MGSRVHRGGRIEASGNPVCAAVLSQTLQPRITIRCLRHLSPVREEYGGRQQPDAHAPQQADDGGGGPNGQRNACQGGAQRAPGVALQEEENELGREVARARNDYDSDVTACGVVGGFFARWSARQH